MNNIEFSEILINNISIYLIWLLIILTSFYFLLRKFYCSIFDPMFLVILISGISTTIPFFLFSVGYCESKYLIYFIIAKIAFWIGFAANYNNNNRFKPIEIYNEEKISYILYLIFYLISIITKFISYILLGIPILLSNRQDIYVDASGLAIFDKIAYPTSFYCLIYSFYLLNKKPILAKTYILYSIATGILGGGKGFILNICAAYFIYKNIYKEEKIKIPIYIYIIILASPILILMISGFSSNFYTAIYDYLFRIIAYGDVYWYSFPYETIEQIHIENPIRHLLSGLLGPFRLIDYSTDGIPIGRLLYWETMPKEFHNTMGGPNARPVILSYILFKYFGIFSCYIFGYIMSYLLTHIKKHLPKGIISSIIVGFIYISFKNIATDPVMAFNGFFSIIIFVIILLSSLFLIQRKYILKRIGIIELKIIKNKQHRKISVNLILSILFFLSSMFMTIIY